MPRRGQGGGGGQCIILNVAEKPAVARALVSVFARMPGSQDAGMRRDAGQIFTHNNVCFPSVFSQGHGLQVNGPGKNEWQR